MTRWIMVFCSVGVLVVSTASLAQASSRPPADSDRDGLPDKVEDRDGDGERDHWETSAEVADTDGDGTNDRHEILASTSPNRNGLLSFPEPMAYDLVRGLDARRGELEVNTLAQLRLYGGRSVLAYAPEVEWAFADGKAIELELPFVGTQLAAVKGALQGTLHMADDGRIGHGWQVLAEVDPKAQHGQVAGKWIGALRLSKRASAVSLLGARLDRHRGHPAQVSGLANVSVFYAVLQRMTVGLETNSAFDRRALAGRVAPQMHVQFNHHLRLQWGVGAYRLGGARGVEGSMRAVVEL